ncbi:phosphoadenylyl-sulfate reductase [Methylocapsa sp. D3K7]|uniref:phosphoadenylyl-sulfate reductase n=1 Tax=Methylocapsa sp. D3K7 TaxID=3041435 RepID=UPI00244EF5A5|nr:phosphoadenylyl-sulfate reductase [Methylocapsa sp. D3K7]WGJ13939.1 phosphoadenylyl-sulfate reductase [Methylocapsa sp. D3K7]
MAGNEAAILEASEKAPRLNAALAGLETAEFLRVVIKDLFPDRIALVSSFGADSAVLLHMVAQIDKATPVLFIDTRVLFEETLAYRDELVAHLGLEKVISIGPKPALLAAEDPENFLWASNPDRCCEIRKVLPLAEALEGYDAWITGRKRFQAQSRGELALLESEGGRIKVNPLAHWPAVKILDYLDAFDLPHHPLVDKGFLSIGCMPCTSPVKPGEDPRAGRWRGKAKVECGLHTLPLFAGADI